MDILRKINKMRLDRDWSIYRLSVESEISQSTLTNMFNRETLPSLTTLAAICRAFGISLSEFFAEEDKRENCDQCEVELINLISSLSPKGREALLNLVREIKESKE